MMSFRSFVLSAMVVLAAGVLPGCSKKDAEVAKPAAGAKEAAVSQGDLDVVKKAHLEFDKSVTIGQALDGYKYFEKKEWLTTKSPEGARLVILKTGMSPEYLKELNQVCSKKNPKQQKIESQQWSIQFTVNPDQTVHVSGTQTLSVLADQKKEAGSLNEELMKSVFKNELAPVCQ